MEQWCLNSSHRGLSDKTSGPFYWIHKVPTTLYANFNVNVLFYVLIHCSQQQTETARGDDGKIIHHSSDTSL